MTPPTPQHDSQLDRAVEIIGDPPQKTGAVLKSLPSTAHGLPNELVDDDPDYAP